MWSKIYLAFLGLSLSVMAFFSYYSWSWLQSIGQSTVAVAGYEYHAGFAWPFLWLSTVVLLLVGNVVLWLSGRAWAVWVTFSYFAVFVLAKFFWLDQTLLEFKRTNMLDAGFSIGAFLALVLIAIMAAIVFFCQFIVVRMHQKMYPPVEYPGSDIEVKSDASV